MANDEIEYLQKRIKEDTKKVEEAKRKAEYENAAQKIHGLYQSFIDSGFSEEQAFYLVFEMVKSAWDKA